MEPITKFSRRFNIGDKVIIVSTEERWKHLIGTECTLTDYVVHPTANIRGYKTDILVNGRTLIGVDECFKPIYDGNQKVSWSECIWKPKTAKVG